MTREVLTLSRTHHQWVDAKGIRVHGPPPYHRRSVMRAAPPAWRAAPRHPGRCDQGCDHGPGSRHPHLVWPRGREQDRRHRTRHLRIRSGVAWSARLTPWQALLPSDRRRHWTRSAVPPRHPHVPPPHPLGPACRADSSRFSARARLGTLHELTKLEPMPIIADALGYHPSTIERHAIGSASTYAEYIAAARGLPVARIHPEAA
jgi:hypothetical protein